MINQFTDNTDPVAHPASVVCRHTYTTPYKTAVVIGIPQGGTSAIAAIVDALGFSMTTTLFNFEKASRPTAGITQSDWLARAAKVDTELSSWGMKDTEIWRFPASVIHVGLRNPYYLVASRDIVATTQRRCANHNCIDPSSILGTIQRVETEVQRLWNWVHALPEAPILLASYERVIRNRRETCEAIAEFLCVSPTPAEIERAANRISKVGGYLIKEVL